VSLIGIGYSIKEQNINVGVASKTKQYN
jgi:hypothetical protein